MFSRTGKWSKTGRTIYRDGASEVLTPERQANRLVNETRTWALSHR
ncbi:MAG TPA: hypothetical protein VKG85_01775 [Actinomycetes bacterium]|nr:hypothetical protein [Actinomycetes bacterium]